MYHRPSKGYFVLLVVVILLYYTLYYNEEKNTYILQKEQVDSPIKQEISYLINTSQCRIPKSNPYSEDIINFISTEKYFKCSDKALLSYISKTNDVVTLHFNHSAQREYSFFNIKCCYSNITRINYETEVDDEIKLTDCIPFEDSVEIKFSYVKVKCSTFFSNVYSNVHATTLPVSKKSKKPGEKPVFSIMLLGIDSMSKSNIERTMPETYKWAEQNMVSLKGYNKVGDNTFPNLMAILTGYNMDQLSTFCNRTIKLNHCRFIWDKFKESQYMTAYAEDECKINTYHFDRPGFLEEPTDYYYRPYFLAAEDLSVVMREDMTYCTGPETSGERILNSAKDFAVTFKDVPSFGLFWSNSYSHDSINMPRVMDKPLLQLLSDTEFNNALNNTVLIFFSDHGFRFGDVRFTHTGWVEERLPFIYFRFPDHFKRTYAEEYNNLITNTNRLTSPYDVHNTLQYILNISNNSYVPLWSEGCQRCQTLFTEIPENRTCKDAGISQHWCTCNGHTYIKPTHPKVTEVSKFVVNQINNILHTTDGGSLCADYTLSKVITSGVSEPYWNEGHKHVHYFLVMLETSPKASFEATVEAAYDGVDKSFKLLGDISRIDRYEPVTGCIKNDGYLKKFCYCNGYKFTKMFRIFR
ncbi:uncharacterized protein LOC126885184 [Diabrotica virgifera virgifera]|uniref:Uncharacterized protein n=1 Tax=Diabrotica virgifera virgifera TaxID=50390 RepID=A0ABM5KBK7_DIAVI|nr:uncharacterized protein LOC126885184 [Diabrotica virgifera virgifera]XP_050507574.1 uncharacterized protein LOC126885184 [Diabrotica virgifera virgifera]XP_050507575.1 uncharacterized protein LOC126885184 [Diabrotica virgifera virgifera]